MRAQESIQAVNIAATTAGFQIQGGIYVLDAVATFGGGSVGLDALLLDGTTWTPALVALTAAGRSAPLNLPPGTYRFTVVTATAVTVALTRVPTE